MKPLSVLHLIEPAAGDEPLIACRAALDIPGVDHAVWSIAGSQAHRRATRAGITADVRILPALSIPELAARRASHLFNERYWSPHAPLPTPDLIMCWSIGTMGLSRMVVGKRGVMRCGMFHRARPALRPGSPAYRREAYAVADVTAFAFGRPIRSAYARTASVGRGLTFLEDNIRLFEPPSPHTPRRISPEDRAAARARLGVPRDHRLIALLADPPRAGDAKRFTFLLGLLYAGHTRVTGVMPAGVSRLGRAARYLREHDRRWGLIVSDLPLEDRLAAADAAVVLPADTRGAEPESALTDPLTLPSAGPVSVAAALALGVPVFSADPLVDRALLDGPDATSTPLSDACLATDFGHDGLPNRIAGRLAPALRDDALLNRLGELSLKRAAAAHAADDFRRDLLALWQEVANFPIIRPGLPTPPILLDHDAADGSARAPLPRNQQAVNA